MDILRKAVYGTGETVNVFRRTSKQVERQTQGAPGAHSRQGTDCLDGILQNL